MIDAARFEVIKRRHGAYGSWALWAPPTSTSKSNMGDLTVLDVLANKALLETMNPSVVMIGLNISRGFAKLLDARLELPGVGPGPSAVKHLPLDQAVVDEGVK